MMNDPPSSIGPTIDTIPSGQLPPAPAVVPTLGPSLQHRDDVTLVKGRYTLVNVGLTPAQAMLADLLFVRTALDDAGIGYLLVRGETERPVLAVAWSARVALWSALRRACADEPFYARSTQGGARKTWLVTEPAPVGTSGSRLLRLYRPRVEPTSGLRYGAAWGVELELWAYGPDEVTLPAENALTRASIPAHELVPVQVERHGHQWPSLEHMFAPHAEDVDFPIDLVFSWVDGSDVRWQQDRAAQMVGHAVGEGDDHAARYRHLDELRYAMRSVHMFAPWVRRIFIATDSPRPAWLADHPSVTLVRSEEFFADPSVLPTHNSMAVEAQLHRIPGLAEHFLYSNDDMFFGRPVPPSMFFSPGGVTKYLDSPTRVGQGKANPLRSGFENSARVNRDLLQARFGRWITRHLAHAAMPLRRSVLTELAETFPEEFAATAASRFRGAANISVTNSLYHHYALLTGRAVRQEHARHMYVDTTSHEGLAQMALLLARRSTDLFCLNDGSAPEVDAEVRSLAVTGFLEQYFPIAAPWEHMTLSRS